MRKKTLEKLACVTLYGIAVSCSHNKADNSPVILDDGAKSGLAGDRLGHRGLLFNRYNREKTGGWPQGKALSRYDAERVRYTEHVHTYHVGRLPSPDRRRMSEAHRVYEIRQDGRWDQRLPVAMRDSTGVVLGVQPANVKPMNNDSRIRAERKRQAEISAALRASHERIAVLEAEMRKKVTGYRDSSEIVDGLKKLLQREIERKKKLESDLQAAKREVLRLQQINDTLRKNKSLENWDKN